MATTGNSSADDSGARSDVAKEQAAKVTGTVKEQGAAVTGAAQVGGQRVASEAVHQVGQLAEQLQTQFKDVLGRSQEEFTGRASEETDKAAAQLRGVAGELRALADGRPDDGPRARDYVGRAADQVEGYAVRLDRDGFAGVVNDLERFARRRPGTFLLGAVAAGFVAGRLARGVQAASGRDHSSSEGSPPASLSASSAAAPQYLLDPPPASSWDDPLVPGQPVGDATGQLPTVLAPTHVAGSAPVGER